MFRVFRQSLIALCISSVSLTSLTYAVETSSSKESALVNFTELVEKVGPSVVNIRTTQKVDLSRDSSAGVDPELEELFKRFFDSQPKSDKSPPPSTKKKPKSSDENLEEVFRGGGSGFIFSQDGFIITNHHVVDGADEIYVTLNDKREYKAKKIGSDRRTDIALIKIDATNLPKAILGDSKKTKVGEWVLAIGSPFGFDNTVTAGIISSMSRDTGEYLPFIQTDVAINPGNSGGPLINMRGEVVGINSQIISRSGGYQGISLSIPIQEASRIIDQLQKTGQVVRGWLGVGISEVSKEIADQLDLPKTNPSMVGAMVRQIDKEGPAAKSDLKVGDIILKLNDSTIEKSTDLPRMVGALKPGQTISLLVWRQGKEKKIEITLGEMAGDSPKKSTENKTQQEENNSTLELLGLKLSDQVDKNKGKAGVLVEDVDQVAARAGIRPGDIITTINNQSVSNVKDFISISNKADHKKPLVLLLLRGDEAFYTVLKYPNKTEGSK
jgi:serine protease Do